MNKLEALKTARREIVHAWGLILNTESTPDEYLHFTYLLGYVSRGLRQVVKTLEASDGN